MRRFTSAGCSWVVSQIAGPVLTSVAGVSSLLIATLMVERMPCRFGWPESAR